MNELLEKFLETEFKSVKEHIDLLHTMICFMDAKLTEMYNHYKDLEEL